MITQYIVT